MFLKKFKVIALVVLFAFAAVYLTHGYQALREKLLNGLIRRSIVAYCAKKYTSKLTVAHVKGNILTHIILENILVESIEGLPQELQIKAKSVALRYNLLGLIRRNPKVEVQGLELRFAKIQVPLKFTQQADVITLVCDKRYLYLNQAEQLASFKKDLILKGLCEISGVLVLKEFKPKLFDVRFNCGSFEIISASIAKARLNVALSLKGESSLPHLTGNILVKEAEYYAEPGEIDPVDLFVLGALDKCYLDLGFKAREIKVKNNTLDVQLKADLRLKKAPQEELYLTGNAECVRGTYFAYQNKFRINKGLILCAGKGKTSAKIDFTAETTVSRYKIFAAVKGDLTDSRLELSSDPALAPNEIAALLLFGKRVTNLDPVQKNKLLSAQEMTDALLAKIFLGRAEARIAKMIGVDDFSLQPSLNSQSQKQPVASLEVGKYIQKDRLYGSYRIQPGQSNGKSSTQTASGEYKLNANIKVKGERSFSESIKLPQEDKAAIEFQWKF